MTKPVLTIEEVEAKFDTWRKDKRGYKPIPEDLWDQVKNLLKYYQRTTVLRRLGLSTEQARNKGLLATVSAEDISTNTTNTFIKVPIMPTTVGKIAAVPAQSTSIAITRGDLQCTLNNPSHEQLQLIINSLLR